MFRRLFYAFCFFSCLVTTAGAQQVLLEDDFENNRNGWRLQNDSNFLVAIENGALHLEKFQKNFTSRGCLWYNKTIPGLNTANDFSITLYAKFLRGGDVSEMLDLQWGEARQRENGRVVSTLHQLTFMFKGRVWLERFERQWTNRVDEDIPSEEMAGFDPKQLNKYEVEQRDGFVIFRINDKEFFRQAYKPVAGNSIGFQQCLKSAWAVDKIIIWQNPVRQRPAPDVVKNSDRPANH